MSASDKVNPAPVTLSWRCCTFDVPGINTMLGDRCSSHASATARHDVALLAGGVARLDHPLVGVLELRRHKFPVNGSDGLLLAVYHPAPGSASAVALDRLRQQIPDTAHAAAPATRRVEPR